MKKIIALVLVALMAMTMVFACAEEAPEEVEIVEEEVEETEDEKPEEEETEDGWLADELEELQEADELDGGWTASESPALTEDIQAIFDKAVEDIDGYTVTPVAYLGSQVVAGTNYAFLCQGKFDDDAKLSYIMLYVTQDTEGNVEILDIADFDIGEYCGY